MDFRARYIEALGAKTPCQQEAALKTAHEIRRFEIDLYWKRATYFWAPQLIAFTVLGFLLSKDGIGKFGLLFIPASLGVVTAFAGVLTAQGSKFWQENWEGHVDLLEAQLEQRLTQVIVCRKAPQSSVSRVNTTLLLLITAGWALILLASVIPHFIDFYKQYAEVCRLSALGTVVAACLWLWFGHTSKFTGRMCELEKTEWQSYWKKNKQQRPFILWARCAV